MSGLSQVYSQVVPVEVHPDGDERERRVTLATLVYDGADPFAVRVSFPQPGDPVAWTFGRELLVEGLTGETGEGDVAVRPDGDAVVLSLLSPGGFAEIRFPRGAIERFLDAAEAVVPLGWESGRIDWDWFLSELLGGGADA